MVKTVLAIPALAVVLVACGPVAASSAAQHRPAITAEQLRLTHGSNVAADVSSLGDRSAGHYQGQNRSHRVQPATYLPARVVVAPQDSGGMVGCGNTPGRAKMMCAPG